MVLHDVFDEEFGGLLSSFVFVRRDQMDHFGGAVGEGQECIEMKGTKLNGRQVDNPVHGDALPFAFGQVDCFEFATLARAFGLVDLTFPASLDMLLDFCT